MPTDAEITNYDPIAERFIEHVGRIDSWNNLYERPNTLARLPELKGKHVLDLGCSTGFYTEFALEHGAIVTAIDASQKLINILAAKVKSAKVNLHCADIGQPMPFLKSGSFHVIICSLLMDYVKDWKPVMAELYRVLKKGGMVVITTGHPFAQYLYTQRIGQPKSYFAFEMFEDVWARRGPQPFKTHYYIRPLHEVLRPIVESKFKIISIDEPAPDERCKEISPETYEVLMERPSFLFIVLEK
jgi:2-polyprenyl-3-methyl-5-hydroxy-6-metoxy-1,4-benzoquinol methylase